MKTKQKRKSANAIMKEKFRASVEWKDFRKQMMIRQNGMDPLTHRKLTRKFNCHHIDQNPDNYKNLDPKNFRCFNQKMHELVHIILSGMKNYGGKDFLDRLYDEMIYEGEINDYI